MNKKYIIGKREKKWIEDFEKLCRSYCRDNKNIIISNCYYGLKEYRTQFYYCNSENICKPLSSPFITKISTLHQMKPETYLEFIIGVVF